jgi:hypothetical protein
MAHGREVYGDGPNDFESTVGIRNINFIVILGN